MFRPSFLTDIRQWYLATYKDRFFTAQAPTWFWFYTVMEAGYHFPFSVYAIGKLWERHGMLTQSISSFVELVIRFTILLEWFGLCISIFSFQRGRGGFLSSSSKSPICFDIYKCSTPILRFSLLLCAHEFYLKDSVLNGKLAAT